MSRGRANTTGAYHIGRTLGLPGLLVTDVIGVYCLLLNHGALLMALQAVVSSASGEGAVVNKEVEWC